MDPMVRRSSTGLGRDLSEGTRIRLEYEGEGLEGYLPVEGAITGYLSGPGADGPWAVVTLDNPLEYQHHLGQPYQYRLVRASRLLIRARLVGHEAGRSPDASVHVLIPLAEEALGKDTFNLNLVYHAAWARCKRIRWCPTAA